MLRVQFAFFVFLNLNFFTYYGMLIVSLTPNNQVWPCLLASSCLLHHQDLNTVLQMAAVVSSISYGFMYVR